MNKFCRLPEITVTDNDIYALLPQSYWHNKIKHDDAGNLFCSLSKSLNLDKYYKISVAVTYLC